MKGYASFDRRTEAGTQMSWISARWSIIKMLESSFWESGREKRNPQGEEKACGAFGRLIDKGKIMQKRCDFPTKPDL